MASKTLTAKDFSDLMDFSATSVRTMQNSVGQVGFAPHNLILASEDFSDSNWTKTATTVTSNAAAAPDGTITADKISHTSTTAQISQDITVVAGPAHKVGVFVKNVDANFIRLYLDGESVWFDLSDGSLGTDNTSEGATSTSLSDGWYYLEAGTVNHNSNFTFFVSLHATDNTGTEESGTEAYIWGAHLYENGLAGMFDVPEDQRALASLTKYLPNKAVVTGPNLVSNGTFDADSEWTKGTGWTIGSGVASCDGTQVGSSGLTQNISVTAGRHYVLTADFTRTAGSNRVKFDGVWIEDGSTASSRHLRVYFTASNTGDRELFVNADANFVGTIDNITVEQVDRNPSAARFLPRRDSHEYIDGAWVKGLKAESEARTNLVVNSSHGGTYTDTGITTSTVSLLGVDGEAVAVVEDTGTSLHRTGSASLSLTLSTDYVASVYVKNYSGSRNVFLNTVSIMGTGVNFDPSTGVINNTTGSPSSTFVEDLGGGVYRVSWTGTGTGSSNKFYAQSNTTTTASDDNFLGDGSSGFVVWGFQIEAGSTPSSLIPTYGATRTRTAETFTQKEDKIIWPNTTYVDGTELWGGAETLGTGWTDNGDGTYTCDGSQVSLTNLLDRWAVDVGDVFEITYSIDSISAGSVGVVVGGTTPDPAKETSAGSYTEIVSVNAVSASIGLQGNSLFVGTVSNISVKEINPRALAVVMHGYMTYADGGNAAEAIFWRQQEDSNNLAQSYLQTSGADTGEVWHEQKSNGTSDTVDGASDTYSPGVNVPFKIASRHLDNALQGAADGTATTENTTPPGLPDLSAVQTEWFYDFMGHITDVRVWVDDITETGIESVTS